MAKGFGELYKLRGIVTYKISHFEQKALYGIISHGFANTLRRITDQIVYIVPPIGLAYIVYDQTEKEHHRLMLKNPADYENEK